mmetsp:Transcript_14294/g.28292  ORF Transcript_14294/g.28292 Transcript_14294/m.28292 type:complete len:82 (-) Transcript_14294:75-320(-)
MSAQQCLVDNPSKQSTDMRTQGTPATVAFLSYAAVQIGLVQLLTTMRPSPLPFGVQQLSFACARCPRVFFRFLSFQALQSS